MHARSTIVAATLWATLGGSLFAQDLGVIGPTYDIAERDLIEAIQSRLRQMQATGELARHEEEYRRHVIEGIEKPRPVSGIKPTETARTFYIDPTYTLDRHIQDEHGRILFPAGTKVNPFDYDRMSKVLLFFDGSKKNQVEFAKRYMAQSKMPVKPILVGGEPLKLMREWKREVFYDQGGALSQRFLIKQTPAVVSQEGKRIRVDEVRP
ncbi:MAG: type-F conjugative transfer system protein TraW [Fimbriimonadales bacterium]|nr:type-F conjugative transfer system protein TraW [Fimbriimonadales bacterium]